MTVGSPENHPRGNFHSRTGEPVHSLNDFLGILRNFKGIIRKFKEFREF